MDLLPNLQKTIKEVDDSESSVFIYTCGMTECKAQTTKTTCKRGIVTSLVH
jgi:hypothetical protein